MCKYKSNYELLCSQLGELNAQIGLQLQRHEADVIALQASIADLQTEKVALEAQLLDVQQALTIQRDAAEQDREYSEHVHRQLGTAAELLKSTEKRLGQQEEHYEAEVERLKSQLVIRNDECGEYQGRVKRLEEEIEVFRAREIAAKEQQILQRQREKSKYKQELMTRTVKLRAVSDELEAQRSALRATKKQAAIVQAENDTLHKQLATVKRDGAHLSNIIDSQRVEHESYAGEFLQTKKAKKQLAKRVAALAQEMEQLQNKLADVKDELAFKNGELENCRDELKSLHIELRRTSQSLDIQHSNDKLMKQVETIQTTENEQCAKDLIEEKDQQPESKYRKELVRMRELLADNQQRATESSKDVQKLRRELLGVQELLHGCTDDGRDSTRQPIDRWADVMQNSDKGEKPVHKSTIMKQVYTFGHLKHE
ncbi:Hypothetical protein PHPALM_10390 [Phytophthora palmivora]|uniref:Uncharacterized protein n=1 Tax=Phytophthora palmivora TaxID=4796 RepID=A0A2P4Y4W6_9STRA|nr:Hypothetical protein PHPALM_10390 [Phytophthora palmivora]